MRYTAEDFAEAIGGFRREVAGFVRRMVVGRTGGGAWQMLGHLLFDVTRREAVDVENYSGVGFYARPPDNAGEGVVVQVGGPNNKALIATRDEATRQAAFADADLAPDETAAYNSAARVHVTAAGLVEARSHGGTAVSLATKADIDDLRSWLVTHLHSGVSTGVGVSGAPSTTPPTASGTSVLKGE